MAGVEGIDVTKLGHLINPDWRNPEDRRCIAASLVNVSYLLERHRSQADQWCCLLQFDIIEKIMDDYDGSIFGAVYQWRGKSKPSEGSPPSLVVAFRGTLLQPKTAFRDLYLDLKVFLGCLHSSSSRVSKSVQCLERHIGREGGSQNVWIAGHSLGASIAVVAAKSLLKKGHNLEAHLFNPPFVSQWLPKLLQKIGMIMSQAHKGSLLLLRLEQEFGSQVSTLMGLTMGLTDHNKLREMVSDFLAVRHWIPNIYVTEKDLICCNYIRYFEEWKRVYGHANGVYLVQKCIKYVFSFEAVPSAKMVEVLVPMRRVFHNHHGISQWYSKDLLIKICEYVPPAEVQVEVGVGRIRTLPACAVADNDEDDSLERWWQLNSTGK